MSRDDNEVLAFARQHGWELEQTGGGCTALQKPDRHEGWWWITDADGGEIPQDLGCPVLLGQYDADGNELDMQRLPNTQAAMEAVAEVHAQDTPTPQPKLVIEWVRVPDHEVPTNLVKLGETVDAESARVLSWHVVPRIGGAHQLYMRLDGIEDGMRFGEWSVARWVQEGGRS